MARHGFIFSRSEHRGPKGHPRQICMPLAILCYLPQIYYCGKLLPQQQLGGLFKPKWYLQAVRRHIEITGAHPHTEEWGKAASKSNHGDQNAAVNGAKHKVMPLMKCWTFAETKKTFWPVTLD